MVKKKIKVSDILGDNYYVYELTSSNYTPALNGSITITCIMKDVYGTAASGKSITLYQNGTSKGAQTTNNSGVATWSITCSTAGLQIFSIKDTSIEVFVDNKEDTLNKVTSLSSSSTDTQYPSAKCVYDTANSKIEKDHKIVTTFLVSDYVTTFSATWNDENTITMTQDSYVEINLQQALYEIGDYIEFVITATNGTFNLNDNSNHIICSGGTIKINIKKTTDSTCTVKTYQNTTLINNNTNYPLSDLQWIFYSTGCTVNFNTKKYYHTVSLIDRIYPIGSIYMSVNFINPSLFIGGTWEQIKDRFLLGCGSTYTNGSTGGEATHKLTTNEMPSHTHIQNSHNHSQNAHLHYGKSDDNSYVMSETNGASNKRVTAVSSGSTYVDTAGSAAFHHYNSTGSTTATNNSQTATNQNTGGGQAHNNMPPYLSVYMWKRIA